MTKIISSGRGLTENLSDIAEEKLICYIQCESKKSPLRFSDIFSKRLGIFNQFLHTYYDHLYTRLQIFIQLFPTMTKLCHTKRDHPANFYISL